MINIYYVALECTDSIGCLILNSLENVNQDGTCEDTEELPENNNYDDTVTSKSNPSQSKSCKFSKMI